MNRGNVEESHKDCGHVAIVGLAVGVTLATSMDVCVVIDDDNDKLLLFQRQLKDLVYTTLVSMVDVMHILVKFAPAHSQTNCMQSLHSISTQTMISTRSLPSLSGTNCIVLTDRMLTGI